MNQIVNAINCDELICSDEKCLANAACKAYDVSRKEVLDSFLYDMDVDSDGRNEVVDGLYQLAYDHGHYKGCEEIERVLCLLMQAVEIFHG